VSYDKPCGRVVFGLRLAVYIGTLYTVMFVAIAMLVGTEAMRMAVLFGAGTVSALPALVVAEVADRRVRKE